MSIVSNAFLERLAGDFKNSKLPGSSAVHQDFNFAYGAVMGTTKWNLLPLQLTILLNILHNIDVIETGQ